MSVIEHDQLLEIIDETLAWASDISEKWTGTMHQKIIDSEVAQLVKAVDENDLDKAQALVYNLGQTLDYADKAFEEADR